MTKDDASPVRAAAAKIVAKDPDPKSAEALIEATSDSHWIVCVAALDARRSGRIRVRCRASIRNWMMRKMW